MFHGHVYFALKNIQQAELLRGKIEAERTDVMNVFPAIPKLVGPHKMPMFEIHFSNNDRNLIEWLDEARGDMSVMIHPVTGEELADHTERAIWLGRELGVFTEKLDV